MSEFNPDDTLPTRLLSAEGWFWIWHGDAAGYAKEVYRVALWKQTEHGIVGLIHSEEGHYLSEPPMAGTYVHLDDMTEQERAAIAATRKRYQQKIDEQRKEYLGLPNEDVGESKSQVGTFKVSQVLQQGVTEVTLICPLCDASHSYPASHTDPEMEWPSPHVSGSSSYNLHCPSCGIWFDFKPLPSPSETL